MPQSFPQLELAYCNLSNVSQFMYLRRVIEHACGDDCDSNRELQCHVRLFASLMFCYVVFLTVQ